VVQGFAQTPAIGKAVVVGTGSFTSFVENMDRSLAFYHDAFGMEVPAPGGRPYNQANPQLFRFFDIAGAKERHPVRERCPTTAKMLLSAL
jgi:catechol 2,3-dioxygenase-like lactoylglutathione lyase family enzyme